MIWEEEIVAKTWIKRVRELCCTTEIFFWDKKSHSLRVSPKSNEIDSKKKFQVVTPD